MQSSRDTHHHSYIIASYEHMNLVESTHITSRRDYEHIHTYIDISTRCAIICTYTSRLLYGHYAQEMLHGHARHRVLGRFAHARHRLGEGD